MKLTDQILRLLFLPVALTAFMLAAQLSGGLVLRTAATIQLPAFAASPPVRAALLD